MAKLSRYWQNGIFRAVNPENPMGKQNTPLLVLTTCPGSITAKKIANELVQEKLAACVQVIPGIQSFFRWVGKVDHSEEILLIIKTTSDRYSQLEGRIIALHPYELPEIVTLPINGGLEGYLKWIETNTTAD
jgi:periplasmic divalent cation tolerance protein